MKIVNELLNRYGVWTMSDHFKLGTDLEFGFPYTCHVSAWAERETKHEWVAQALSCCRFNTGWRRAPQGKYHHLPLPLQKQGTPVVGRVEITGNMMQQKDHESFGTDDMSRWLEMSKFFCFAFYFPSKVHAWPWSYCTNKGRMEGLARAVPSSVYFLLLFLSIVHCMRPTIAEQQI